MSTALWFFLIGVVWSSIGLVVSIVLGRIFRHLNSLPEEAENRLIC